MRENEPQAQERDPSEEESATRAWLGLCLVWCTIYRRSECCSLPTAPESPPPQSPRSRRADPNGGTRKRSKKKMKKEKRWKQSACPIPHPSWWRCWWRCNRERENISVVVQVTVGRAKKRREERKGEGMRSLSGEQGKQTDSRWVPRVVGA